MDKAQSYYGKVIKVDESDKYIESAILHFDVANENRWVALSGSLDAFLERLRRAKKDIPACYQHDESILIGTWKEIKIENGVLSGKLFYIETQFVKDTVLPLLKAGALQGASPTISPIKEAYNNEKGIWEIIEGALCEVSLVGLPADLKADITAYKASITPEPTEDFLVELY